MRWAKQTPNTSRPYAGFTIIELLIVIVVISILAGLVVVAYNGIQGKARSAKLQKDVVSVEEMIEVYHTRNGEYPKTTENSKANWRTVDVRTDDNCTNGSSQVDWVPGVTEDLPQSDPSARGVDGKIGCYLYASDGTYYVISAWNMLGSPQSETMYRRLGFRAFQTDTSTQFYTCNDNVVGGANSGYSAAKDYYKHSYTLSNITDCNETPPPGA